MDQQDIIRGLELRPHPEGGWFRETWRESSDDGIRSAGSAIYFLLTRGSDSRLHRIDAAEIWHFYAGAVAELVVTDSSGSETVHLVGPDLQNDQRPQVIVPPGAWQRARTTGDFSLVGCTVSPAFDWSRFELG
jgi:uncharacterized protein